MEWRVVPGFEGILEVSRQGDVRNLLTGILFLAYRINNDNEYIRYNYKDLSGKWSSQAIHRLVAKAFVGGYKPNLIVNHINGIKWDNRAENLEWCTHSENSRKALALGSWRGSRVSTPFWAKYWPIVMASIPPLEKVS